MTTNTDKMMTDLIAYAVEANECDMVSPEHMKRAHRLARLLGVQFIDVMDAVRD